MTSEPDDLYDKLNPYGQELLKKASDGNADLGHYKISAKGVNTLRKHQNKVALKALRDARDYIVGSHPLQLTNDVTVRLDKAIELLEETK